MLWRKQIKIKQTNKQTKNKQTNVSVQISKFASDTEIPHKSHFLFYPFFCHDDDYDDATAAAAAAADDDGDDDAAASAAADDNYNHDCDDNNEYDNCWGATYWNQVCHTSLDPACNHRA